MKIRRPPAILLAIVGALLVLGLLVVHFSQPPAAHVQLVVASDGSLLVAGVPGRSMRSRIQNPAIWNGQEATSMYVTEWLRSASIAEKRAGTYDGRLLVIVDDHASFQILKMLVASARVAYPTVSYVNGVVSELPRQHGVDKDHPVDDYMKDCSAKPMPQGCAPAK